jgi:glycosyltransferase involved in cell wall biosynthesis
VATASALFRLRQGGKNRFFDCSGGFAARTIEKAPGAASSNKIMNQIPFFTVLVPTYNQARYLGAALDSLLAQTDADWEAIIVNDGSTDETAEVIAAYVARDSRFRALHKPNGGVASALNMGLAEARSPWVCWLSSDDLFEPAKLAVHRRWIGLQPASRFFCSGFSELDDASGRIHRRELWAPVPEARWQVLEMLRCIYIPGNSVCVARELWQASGGFDPGLRHGQDYDMWLRLLVQHPVTYIPERTCIARLHPQQGTQTFREVGFFDCARAGIQLLNHCSFAELLPQIELEDPLQAHTAVEYALRIAGNPFSFLYMRGPHPALIGRIMEWVWHSADPKQAPALKTLVAKWARGNSRRHAGTPFSLLWKAAAIAAAMPEQQFHYQPIDPGEVTESYYWSLLAVGDEKAEPLRRHLARYEQIRLPEATAAEAGKVHEAIFLAQRGAPVDVRIKYGAFRSTIEGAKYLLQRGRRVLLMGLAQQGLGLNEGVLYVGAPDEQSLARAVAAAGPVDAIIGVSRGDILRMVCARRYLVYHMGPHPVQEAAISNLNRAGAPIICPSHSAVARQIGYGLRSELLHAVHPAYDPQVFVPAEGPRRPHSLVFAGSIAQYKGVDIALRAFQQIKAQVPDANLHIVGDSRPWPEAGEHLLDTSWLDSDGYPNWAAICRDLPGLSYGGAVEQWQLAGILQQSELLVTPSRVGETFGIVSLEAQACGCIPVLPDNGAFPETMQAGVTGYLYTPNTPEQLAARILELWQAGLPAETQRQAAAEWARGNFSWDRTGVALLAILEGAPKHACARQVWLQKAAWWHARHSRPRLLRAARRIASLQRAVHRQPLSRWPGIIQSLWLKRRQNKPGSST